MKNKEFYERLRQRADSSKNDYSFTLTLSGRITFCLILLMFISINLTPESDFHREIMRKAALGLGLFGILFSVFYDIKTMYKKFKHDFFIKFYDDKILFDCIDENAKFKTLTLYNADILSITWALMPYNAKGRNIWIKDIKNRDDKIFAYLASPLYFLVTILRHFIFLALNGLKFKKYLLYRFKSGVISVQKNQISSNQNIKFELFSLLGLYVSDDS